MKKLFFAMALLVMSVAVQAQIKNASLQASGLTCAMCSKAIYKALTAIPFIEKVTPDIEGSTYNIVFKDGANVDPDALSKAVTGAGFSVAVLKLTTDFSDTKVKKDAHVTIGNKTFHFVDVKDQTLNGEKTITLVDKNFVPAKAFKKYSQLTSMKCYQTGTMASCCPSGNESGKRVYHVTI